MHSTPHSTLHNPHFLKWAATRGIRIHGKNGGVEAGLDEAQLAGFLLLRRQEHANKLAFLLSLDKVKFRKTVVPGDQLRLEAETKKLRQKTGQMACRALVDGNVVAEALITFMIVDTY